MKLRSTMILKATVIFIGLIVLAICIFGLPKLIISELAGDFDYGPIFLGMYITAVPFFLALSQAFKLLSNIDAHKAFSKTSVSALRNTKFSGFAISALYAAGMPYIFYIADRDDAPGLAALGFVIIGASFVVATAAAVFQELFQDAVDLKSENDLTV